MPLTEEDILRLETLARLRLTPEERARLTADLQGVFALFARLANAPTEGVAPLAHPLELTQRLREDVVSEPDHRDALMALAPAAEAGLYLVPKVIE